MDGESTELRVSVELESSSDAGEIEEETLRLRDELLDLDVENVVQPGAGPGPAGSRGAEVALLGTLVVTTGRDAMRAVVQTVAAWLSRAPGRRVSLKMGDDSIELTDVSREDQRRLLDAFLERQAGRGM